MLPYTLYTLSRFSIERAVIVDTDYPERLYRSLSSLHHLTVIRGDFADASIASQVGQVDVLFFFDALLHQANPDWDSVLRQYATHATCVIVYNQQYVKDGMSVRLTALPLEEYTHLTSDRRVEFYHQVYAHRTEIHPRHRKPWIDIYNIAQWGITDADLRATMQTLGFSEVYYQNYGRFLNLPAFENHGFVFKRQILKPGNQSGRNVSGRRG